MSLVAETATLIHGFTMADLDRAAQVASRKWYYGRVMNDTDRYECAWFAAAALLYKSETAPTFYDLLVAGRDAIGKEANAELHHHGIDKNNLKPMPRFGLYWDTADRNGRWPQDFTDDVIERMALPQVLGLLSPKEYEAVSALAVHGSEAGAANAIGITVGALKGRLKRARCRINEAWLAPDRPRQRRDNECMSGHDRAEHGYVNGRGNWVCRVCARNKHRRLRARGYVEPGKPMSGARV